jgi:hypothetical protein
MILRFAVRHVVDQWQVDAEVMKFVVEGRGALASCMSSSLACIEPMLQSHPRDCYICLIELLSSEDLKPCIIVMLIHDEHDLVNNHPQDQGEPHAG